MLERKLEGDILTVKQVLMSFHGTAISWWYYDVKRWLKSQHGREGDVPVQPMTDEQIAWVKKYDLPAAMGALRGN